MFRQDIIWLGGAEKIPRENLYTQTMAVLLQEVLNMQRLLKKNKRVMRRCDFSFKGFTHESEPLSAYYLIILL